MHELRILWFEIHIYENTSFSKRMISLSVGSLDDEIFSEKCEQHLSEQILSILTKSSQLLSIISRNIILKTCSVIKWKNSNLVNIYLLEIFNGKDYRTVEWVWNSTKLNSFQELWWLRLNFLLSRLWLRNGDCSERCSYM